MKSRFFKIRARLGYQLGVSVINPDSTLPSILLLNGSAFNFLQWDNLLRYGFCLAEHPQYQVIRYDYGGTGTSVTSAVSWSLENIASEIECVLDALCIERIHLYGISMGTIVGQAMLSFAPQRVVSLAGYGWYFHRYSALQTLSKFLIRRLGKFSDLADQFPELLTWDRFRMLWTKVYREIVLAKPVEKFTILDWLIDWYLQRKLFPVLEPTPIGTIKAWFDYALNELPKLSAEFDRIQPLSGEIPMLLQHARFDETLPVEMALELHAWCKAAKLIDYPKPFSHLSPAFKSSQARHLIGDYLGWLGSLDS